MYLPDAPGPLFQTVVHFCVGVMIGRTAFDCWWTWRRWRGGPDE